VAGVAVTEPDAIVTASAITAVSSLVSVLIAIVPQTRRINRDHRAALADQTDELKQHIEGGAPSDDDRLSGRQ
jgi:hypothetical protein